MTSTEETYSDGDSAIPDVGVGACVVIDVISYVTTTSCSSHVVETIVHLPAIS